MFYMYVNKYVA